MPGRIGKRNRNKFNSKQKLKIFAKGCGIRREISKLASDDERIKEKDGDTTVSLLLDVFHHYCQIQNDLWKHNFYELLTEETRDIYRQRGFEIPKTESEHWRFSFETGRLLFTGVIPELANVFEYCLTHTDF